MNFTQLKQRLAHLAFFISLIVLCSTNVQAEQLTAPDPATEGPHQVSSGEYRFPSTIYPEITQDRVTEIWAKAFYPRDIKSLSNIPVVVFLHGQHNSCITADGSEDRGYQTDGTCKSDNNKELNVIKNHEGYNYLGEYLASWGYFVISVNTNLINTYLVDDAINNVDSGDQGLYGMRGKTILKHLNFLSEWSRNGNAPLTLGLGKDGLINKLDFSNVGLMGHSNGGPGVRSAYTISQNEKNVWADKIPGLTIKGIFEIAGADSPIITSNNPTPYFLNAKNISWAALTPLCDGEIPYGSGRMPFERMMLDSSEAPNNFKAVYQVWGANHRFFNSKWNITDAYINFNCRNLDNTIFDSRATTSNDQQLIAIASAGAFFRANVGVNANPDLNKNFNPLYSLPESVTKLTQVDRNYALTLASKKTKIVADFNVESGKNNLGFNNTTNNITFKQILLDEYDMTEQKIADISWQSASHDTYFETPVANAQQGVDLKNFATLDFRIARADSKLNTEKQTDFSIALVDNEGRSSNIIPVSNYTIVNGPTLVSAGDGSDEYPDTYPIILKTVRIPLTEFIGVNLSSIRSIKFTFEKSNSGELYFGNIRFSETP